MTIVDDRRRRWCLEMGSGQDDREPGDDDREAGRKRATICSAIEGIPLPASRRPPAREACDRRRGINSLDDRQKRTRTRAGDGLAVHHFGGSRRFGEAAHCGGARAVGELIRAGRQGLVDV